MSKIYLSSSWRNIDRVRALAAKLREAEHEVFDFTSRANAVPRDNVPAFVDQPYGPYLDSIRSLIKDQIELDLEEIEQSDVLVLLLPAGSDSHFELGYAISLGMDTYVVGQPKPDQFVGMHLMCDAVLADDATLLARLLS